MARPRGGGGLVGDRLSYFPFPRSVTASEMFCLRPLCHMPSVFCSCGTEAFLHTLLRHFHPRGSFPIVVFALGETWGLAALVEMLGRC